MLHESVCNFIFGQKKDGPVNKSGVIKKKSPFVRILNMTIDISSCVASQYQKLYIFNPLRRMIIDASESGKGFKGISKQFTKKKKKKLERLDSQFQNT